MRSKLINNQLNILYGCLLDLSYQNLRPVVFLVVGLILPCSARIYWHRACRKRISKVKSAPTKCNQNDSNNELINLELEVQ